MLSTFVPRIGALLAQRSVQVIAAGLLSGTLIGGAGLATGLIPVGGSGVSPTIGLLACPGSGPELARVSAGQTLLVTGRSADGVWLEVYVGEPGIDRGWVPATALRLQSTVDSLPTAACRTDVAVQPSASAPAPSFPPSPTNAATVPPSVQPTRSATPSPTPKPSAAPKPSATTKPRATPKPTSAPTSVAVPTATPAPDLTNPTLSGMHVTSTCIGPDISSSTVSVTATDPDDPIVGVSMRAQFPGSDLWGFPFDMSYAGGNVWQTTFTYSSSMATDGYINYYATASDSHGNLSGSLGSDTSSSDNFIQVAPSGCTIH